MNSSNVVRILIGDSWQNKAMITFCHNYVPSWKAAIGKYNSWRCITSCNIPHMNRWSILGDTILDHIALCNITWWIAAVFMSRHTVLDTIVIGKREYIEKYYLYISISTLIAHIIQSRKLIRDAFVANGALVTFSNIHLWISFYTKKNTILENVIVNICVIHSFWSDYRDHSGIPSDPWGHSKMSE